MSVSNSITRNARDMHHSLVLTNGIRPDSLQTKMEYNKDGVQTGMPKLYKGYPQYRIPAIYADDDGIDLSVSSICVLNAPSQIIPGFTQCVFLGTVRFIPWNNNGRIGWSILADGIKPLRKLPLDYGEEVKTDDQKEEQ